MLSQAEIDALLSGAIELDQKDGMSSVNLADLMGPGTPGDPGTAAGLPGADPFGGVDPIAAAAAAAAASANAAGRRITSYNFWSPDRFSKEQMRAVELVHEDLTERLTTALPTFLRTNVRPRLVHTEQGRFHDFLKDFPTNTLFHMITLAPLPNQMIFTLSPNVSYMILEQRLGGKIEGKIQERPLTEIDQSLLRGLVEHMLGDIKAAWSKVVSLEPTLEDSTINQHWVQMMMGNERVMLLTFELNVQSTTGTMNIFIPFNTLKPIANVLNPHIWIAGRKERQEDPVARATAMDQINRVVVPINVLLGSADVALGDILKLKVGDVIQLETNVSDSLVIQVAKKNQFSGKVGRSGKHLAVQVTGVIRDPDAVMGSK